MVSQARHDPWPPRRRDLRLSPRAERWLPTVKRRIVRGFRPDRIILFGSQVAGTADADSDIDLLVVMPHLDDPASVTLAIRKALSGLPVSRDIVVTTPESVERFGDISGTVLYPALREGATIYARS